MANLTSRTCASVGLTIPVNISGFVGFIDTPPLVNRTGCILKTRLRIHEARADIALTCFREMITVSTDSQTNGSDILAYMIGHIQ